MDYCDFKNKIKFDKNYYNWLKTLKKDDEIIIGNEYTSLYNYINRDYSLAKVTSIENNFIEINYTMLFDKNGYCKIKDYFGNGNKHYHIFPMNQDLKLLIIREDMIKRIEQYKYRLLSNDKLKRINDILNES